MKMKLRIVDNIKENSGKLTDQDYEAICGLIKNTLQESNNGVYEQKHIDFISSFMTPEIMKKKTENAYCVLYEEQGLKGFGFLADRNGWEIKGMYTSQKRKGIGSNILEKLENKAKEIGIDKIYIESLNNPDTIQFYEKRGYKVKEILSEQIKGSKMEMTAMEKRLE